MNKAKIILNIIAYAALQVISMNGAELTSPTAHEDEDEKTHCTLEIVSAHNPLTHNHPNGDTHKKRITRNTNGLLEGTLNLVPGIVQCCTLLWYHQLPDKVKIGITMGLAMSSALYTSVGMAYYHCSRRANQQDKNDYQLSASAALTAGIGLGCEAVGLGYPTYLKPLSGVGGAIMVSSGVYHIAKRLKQRAELLPHSWLNRLPLCHR